MLADDHYNARAQGQVNGDESTPEEPPAPKKPPAKKKQVAKDDVTAEEWAAWRNESSTSVVPEHGLPVLSIPNFDISSATASRANGTSILNVSATEQRDGSNTPSAVGLAAGASSTGNRLKDTSNSNTPPRQRVHASNAIGTPNKAQPSSDHVSTPVVNRNQAIEVKTPQPPEIPLPGPDAELYHIANGRSAV
jgi:hypothetical protein